MILLKYHRFHTGFRRRYQENIEPEYYKQKQIAEQQKEQQIAEHNVKRAANLNQMKNVYYLFFIFIYYLFIIIYLFFIQRHGYNIITGEPLANPNPLPDKPRAQRRHLTGEFSDEIKRETEIRLLNSKHRFHAEFKETPNGLERTSLLAQNGIPDSHKFSTIIGYGSRNLQSKGVQDNFVGNEYYKPPVGATVNTLAAAGTSVTRVPSVHNNYPRDEKLFTGNATVESYLSQSQARPPTYKQQSNRTSARKNNGPLPKTLEIQSVRDLPPYQFNKCNCLIYFFNKL